MGCETDREIILRTARDFTADMASRFGYVENRPISLHVLPDALVTRTTYPGPETFTGAVHDSEGRLVRSSQRRDPQAIQPVDPEIAPASEREGAERVPTAIYGGMLFLILGHFLFESAARLWVQRDFRPGRGAAPLPVIYHPCPGFDLQIFLDMPFLRQGFAALDVTPETLLIADRNFVVERLYYPETLSIYHEYVHPLMDGLLDHLAERVLAARRVPFWRPRPPTGPAKVFLSRSKWQLHVRIENEVEMEDAFRERGFAIVHPQDLAPDEIIGLMRRAEMVASSDGSHAHLLSFARRGTRCLHLDTRPVPTQTAIEKLRGLQALHVPLFLNPGGIWDEATKRADMDKLGFLLDAFVAGTVDGMAAAV